MGGVLPEIQGPTPMDCSKLAQRVISLYARDLPGFTPDDARRLISADCLSPGADIENARSALVESLALGAAGAITAAEQDRLRQVGLADEFIAGLAGNDGRLALRQRADWLVAHVGRGFFGLTPKERVLVMRELSDLGDDTSLAAPALIHALGDADLRVRREAAQALGDLKAVAAVPALLTKLGTWSEGDRVVLITALGAIATVMPPADYAEKVLPHLRTALRHDPAMPVRLAAAQALGELAAMSTDAVADLIQALADPQWWVRQRAAWALGRMGEAVTGRDADGNDEPDAVTALIETLRSWPAGDRRVSCVALTAIGRPAVVPLVAVMLRTGSEPLWARQEAALVLGEIGDPAGVNYLVVGLADPDPAIEAAVQGALIRLGEKAVYELARVLERARERPAYARSAANLLVILGLDHPETLTTLSTRFQHADALVVELAIETVGFIGAEAAGASREKTLSLAPRLLDLLQQERSGLSPDENWLIRTAATRALGRMRDSSAATVEVLLSATLDWPEEHSSVPAEALVNMGAAVVPRVSQGCRQCRPDRQGLLLDVLADIGAPAVGGLVQLANTAPEPLATRAWERLLALQPSMTLPALATALIARPEDATPRTKEVFSRGETGAVPALILLLQQGNTSLLRFAADILGELGPPAALARPALLSVLENETAAPAYNAVVTALVRIGPPEIPELINALASPSKALRRYAKDALVRIGMPAVPALIAVLEDPRSYIVLESMEVLSRLGTESLTLLIRGTHRGSVAVRERIAHIISTFNPLPLTALLDEAERADTTVSARVTAVWLLGEIKQPAIAALPRLFELLRLEIAALSEAVKLACEKIGPPDAAVLDKLRWALASEHEGIATIARYIFSAWEVEP
jgi:HEAT repeat protein